MNTLTLRHLIRILLERSGPRALLLEPDEPADDQDLQGEYSAAGAISGGPAMPMSVGPHYPGPDMSAQNRIDSQIDVVGRSFGGAKPAKRKRRKKK